MARWAPVVAVLVAPLAMPAAGCSLLVDSNVGVRSDGGAGGDIDGTPEVGPGGDAAVCPGNQVNFPSFSDDFADDGLVWAIDPKIQRDGPGAIAAGVASGELRFAPGAAGTDSAWVKSVEFQLLEGRVAVRIPALTTDADAEAYVAMLAPGARYEMWFDGSKLRVPGGTAVTYVGDAHVWWQIRNEDFYLHFETSPDGATFTELDSVPADLDPTQVRIEIGISVGAAGAASRGEFTVDDLNLPPCR